MATIGKLWCIKAAREAGDNVQPLEASFEMELHRIVFLIIFFLLCLQMFLAVSHFHQALAYLALLPLPPDATFSLCNKQHTTMKLLRQVSIYCRAAPPKQALSLIVRKPLFIFYADSGVYIAICRASFGQGVTDKFCP